MAGICVYAEQEQGIVAPVTFEILRCALERKNLPARRSVCRWTVESRMRSYPS